MAVPTHDITLTVRNTSTGAALSGATVELKRGAATETLTEIASSGTYQGSAIPAGAYDVWVNSLDSGDDFVVGGGELEALGFTADSFPVSTSSSYAFKTPAQVKTLLSLDNVNNVSVPVPIVADAGKFLTVDGSGNYVLAVSSTTASLTLAEVAYYSLTTADQTFALNSGTNLIFESSVGTDLFIINESSGNIGIGTTGPDAKLDVLSTSTQLRLTYTDGSVYTDLQTDGAGNLNLKPISGLVLSVNTSGSTYTNYYEMFRFYNQTSDSPSYTHGLSVFSKGESYGSALVSNITAINAGAGTISKDFITRASTMIELINSSGASEYGQLKFKSVLSGANNTLRTIFSTDVDANFGINTESMNARLDVLETSYAQLRLTYTDGSVYTDFFTNSSGHLVISPSSNIVLIGTNTSTNNTRLNQKLSIVGTDLTGASIVSYAGSTSGNRGLLDFKRSRGTSDQSFTAVTNSDELGSIVWFGTDGSAFQQSAAIDALIDAGSISSTSMPGLITFRTSSNGSISPTEKMRITESGNVGIGTTGPDAKLDVLSTSTQLRLTYTDGSVYTDFSTNSSGYLNIDPSGNRVGLNIASPQAALHINSTTSLVCRMDYDGYVDHTLYAVNEGYGIDVVGTNPFIWMSLNSTLYYDFQTTYFAPGTDNTQNLGNASFRWATVYAGTGTINTSDIREKTNIIPIEKGLDFICELNPIKYSFKSNPEKNHYGLIAQEVAELIDEADYLVDRNPEKYGLAYTELIAPIIKAIQELKSELEVLKNA